MAPPTLLPIGVGQWPCSVSYNMDETLAKGVDAVMMLRVQGERMKHRSSPRPANTPAAGASTTTASGPWTNWV